MVSWPDIKFTLWMDGDHSLKNLEALFNCGSQLITSDELALLNGVEAPTSNPSVDALFEEVGQSVQLGSNTRLESVRLTAFMDNGLQLGFQAFPRPKRDVAS